MPQKVNAVGFMRRLGTALTGSLDRPTGVGQTPQQYHVCDRHDCENTEPGGKPKPTAESCGRPDKRKPCAKNGDDNKQFRNSD